MYALYLCNIATWITHIINKGIDKGVMMICFSSLLAKTLPLSLSLKTPRNPRNQNNLLQDFNLESSVVCVRGKSVTIFSTLLVGSDYLSYSSKVYYDTSDCGYTSLRSASFRKANSLELMVWVAFGTQLVKAGARQLCSPASVHMGHTDLSVQKNVLIIRRAK